jgi:hypothetical protein
MGGVWPRGVGACDDSLPSRLAGPLERGACQPAPHLIPDGYGARRGRCGPDGGPADRDPDQVTDPVAVADRGTVMDPVTVTVMDPVTVTVMDPVTVTVMDPVTVTVMDPVTVTDPVPRRGLAVPGTDIAPSRTRDRVRPDTSRHGGDAPQVQ